MVLLEDREILAQLPGLLLPWYDGGARVLPWREEPTPYRVWVKSCCSKPGWRRCAPIMSGS